MFQGKLEDLSFVDYKRTLGCNLIIQNSPYYSFLSLKNQGIIPDHCLALACPFALMSAQGVWQLLLGLDFKARADHDSILPPGRHPSMG